MKPIARICLFVLLLISLAQCASAQNYPIKERDGSQYYVFTTSPGNTLFAISQQFSVKVEDLLRANPDAAEGLGVGQEVYVPIADINKKSARNSEIKTDGVYVLHTVQRKETLFSVAKQYGVTIDELVAINPDQAKGLNTGSEIRIPVLKSSRVDEIFLVPAKSDTFMVHQIQSGETAYAISKKYAISLDSLNEANNNFDSGIRVGQWIRVPKYTEVYQAEIDSIKAANPTSGIVYKAGNKATYKLAMLLPFELHLNDSINKSLSQGKELFVLTEIALEYYRGSRMALDSLQKLGLNAEVYVYDVGEDVVDAKQVLRKPDMRDIDLIFGPMHKASLAVVSDFTKGNGTYLVSPNTFSNEIFDDNPYLFRSSASRETMLRYLANYVAIQHAKDNVLMVTSERQNDWTYRKLFREYYNEAMGRFPNSFSDSIRTAGKNAFSDANLSKWLRPNVKNILVVPSNELAFVSDFMTRLSRISEKAYDIQVYGLDQWMRYDNMEASYKNRFKLRLVVPSYVDYQKESVSVFLEGFREKYGMEPSKYGYGFLGYDLTMFFGLALLEEGMGFPASIADRSMTGVYTGYRFGKSSTGIDFENKSVYILEYDDYSLKRVN